MTDKRSPAKATVFRAMGLPLGATVGDLEVMFLEAFEEDAILDTKQSTIFPSCYGDGSQTALFQFKSFPPRELNILPNGDEYLFEYNDYDISIDKSFHNLTQLYPISGAIKADIVAVSGINGHAYGSWRGRGSLGKMWLRDFFPKDFPDCRTMIYGYNSSFKCRGMHKTLDFAKGLLEELGKVRKTEEEKNRPIAFIGHSFGGVVITQALVRAKDSRDGDIVPLLPATYATIFFGTPHRGLVVDDILAMLEEDSPRKELVKSIGKGSGLEKELARFITYSTGVKIVSFSETKETRKLKKGKDGQYSRAGDYFTAVEKDSSVLQLPDKIEAKLSAEGDHSNMVKFDHEEDPSYTNVCKYLDGLRCFVSRNRNARAISLANHYNTACKAIIGNDLDSLERVLEAAPEVVGEADMTNKIALLHVAVKGGDKDMVSTLLKRGAKAGVEDRDGNTALHNVALLGHREVLGVLLEYDVDINATDGRRFTALHFAAQHGHLDIVRDLYENGAEVSKQSDGGFTALHLAAENGHVRVVDFLRQEGADLEARDNCGYTALHHAARWGHGVVTDLVQWGADMTATNKAGHTALHTAATNKSEIGVELLLLYGADIGAQDNSGWTALHVAAHLGNERVVKTLLDKGAETETEKEYEWTVLHTAAMGGVSEVVGLLLSRGANIEAKGKNGWTALHAAAEGRHGAVVKVLLEKGAETGVKDKDGRTALHIAIEYRHKEVVKIILEKEIETGPNVEGWEALNYAADHRYTKMVRTLLEKRASI